MTGPSVVKCVHAFSSGGDRLVLSKLTACYTLQGYRLCLPCRTFSPGVVLPTSGSPPLSFIPTAYGALPLVQNCTEGYYCAKGAAAALPCPGGTTKRLSIIMKAKEDCDVCGEGTFCPVGSGVATNCSAGTYNALKKRETCTNCAAGTFQDTEGSTACQVQCWPMRNTHASLRCE